jgi:hypothetical protein
VSGEPTGSQDQSTAKRLEAGRAADVGMSQARLDRVVDCLTVETGQRHLTSASICVARHGRIVLHRGFGRLSEQTDAPPTGPNSVYILASISKPIAVCGLMLLVERPFWSILHGLLTLTGRRAEFGHQLSLTGADWLTVSGGKEPFATVGRNGAIDPFRSVAIFDSGRLRDLLCHRVGSYELIAESSDRPPKVIARRAGLGSRG